MAKRVGNIIYDNFDRFTGEAFNTTVLPVNKPGTETPYTDADVDNVIIFKNKPSLGGGYSMRNFTGAVNVKWFGAKGDLVNDDTEAIQKAIDNLYAQSGGVLFFDKGGYKISATLKLKPGVKIKGDGFADYSRYPIVKASVIKPSSDFVGNSVIEIDSFNDNESIIMSGASICNMVIDLDLISSTETIGLTIKSLSNPEKFSNIIFINADRNTCLYVSKTNLALPNASDGIVFENVFTYYKTVNYNSHPVEVCVLADGCNELTFINCKFQLRSDDINPANKTKGVAIKGLCYAITFESCAMAGCYYGVYVTSPDPSGSGSDWIRVNNCTFETYTIGVGYGIDVSSDNAILFPRRLSMGEGNRFIASKGGATVRNVLLDKSIGCTLILDEYVIDGKVCELTANALGCSVFTSPLNTINNSSTSIVFGRNGNKLSFIGDVVETEIALINNWVDYSASRLSPRVKKNNNYGLVSLEGMVKDGTVGYLTPIFILPEGFRPYKSIEFIVNSNGTSGILLIEDNGNVSLQSGSNAFVSLSGVSFYL